MVEVDRPDRRTRRQRGKSDPIDAKAAARAALAGVATAVPKRRDGIVEVIRVLRTARRGASKARTAAINHLKALLVTAPALVREALDGRPVSVLVTSCARLRPDETGLTDLAHASKAALRAIAHRFQLLEAEITLADQRLAKLVGRGCWACSAPCCWRPSSQVPLGGNLPVRRVDRGGGQLAALWLLVAVAAAAAWRSQPPTPGQRMR